MTDIGGKLYYVGADGSRSMFDKSNGEYGYTESYVTGTGYYDITFGERFVPLGGRVQQEGPQNDPLQNSNGERVWTLEEFYEANKGRSREEIIDQRERQMWGLVKGGPNIRYVRNPRDGNVIDMRHMLIRGPYGPGGTVIEWGQWLVRYPGGRNAQDYYSNDLGGDFNGFRRMNHLGEKSKYADYLYQFFTTDHYYNKKK